VTQAKHPVRSVGLVSDPLFERHDTGPWHPERPERLLACRRAISAQGLDERCTAIRPEPASDAMLERVHDPAYVRHVVTTCTAGRRTLDSGDTKVCAESDRIAREAAGGLARLAGEVAGGRLDRGFALLRPPGHHAERNVAMGFCLYNSIAVAAAELRANGMDRVLIVDWDVHHGNGTQHIFEEDESVFYFSVHQWPLYPGTGAREETGKGPGRGATLNCPLPPGAGDDAFLGALRDELVPAAERFQPDIVLLSAGFDAHRADPLAGLEVSTDAYAEATRILCDLAADVSAGRLVSVLEGGYDLDALAASATLHLRTLLDHPA
jgi:acetoin utilization deacetylase AcuC-like enzyme